MEVKLSPSGKDKKVLKKAWKFIGTSVGKAFGHVRAFLARIWKLLCKNKHFARFAHVTFPSWKKRINSYIKKHYRRVILVACLCAAALAVILGVLIKNTSDSDIEPEVGKEPMFAAAVPLYPSFNAEERVYDAVLLSWEDGAVDLKDGTAKVRIKAQVYPITLKDKTITWSSSDEEIAQIDEEGMITASKAGTAEITATLESRSLSATAQLSVRQPVSSVFLPTSTITLYVGGESRLLSAKVFPEDATNQNIKWSSKDTKVARVDSTGRVTPVGAGMTEITATTEDGGFEAKCFVSVVNKTVEVETVSVKNGENMKLTVGESVNAIVSVSPSNAKNKTLTWSSDNEAVAKVSQTGRIRAVGAGTANITVKTQNGKNAVFKVEVAAGDGKDPFDLSETTEETVTEGGVTYTSYNMSFMQAVKTQMLQNPPPKIWKDGSTVYASEIETAQYMNPSNYYTDAYKYQFLDLSKTNNVSEARLNEYLADKGVLRGKGAVFIAAAQKYNVSEVYLVAHACLESGNGTSTLATGVSVNGTTVYNVFGINAYDSAPVSSGSSKAYAEGWTSVDKAIYGGAQWISENYINSTAGKQNTLYKMRWNPENSGSHQYATDISWAVKQAVSIEKIFSSFADASLSFDVPVYSGQVPPTIDTN